MRSGRRRATRCAAALRVGVPDTGGLGEPRRHPTLAASFDVPVGLSDHGSDPLAPALAVALGASIYERHFVSRSTTRRSIARCRHAEEFADVVVLADATRSLLGHGRKECLAAEAGNVTASRRGVYAAATSRPGTALADDRPADAATASEVPAQRWRELIGRRLRVPVAAGTAIPLAALEPPLGEPTW